MHILLVEDDSAITMGLDYTLKKEGYAVCICMSVEQARDALSKQRFDLALIDLSLPDGSGFDLCDPARAQGAAVIFLTASDDEMCVVKGLDMGGDDYVTKPFRLQELLSRIRSVLRRRQDRQDDIIRMWIFARPRYSETARKYTCPPWNISFSCSSCIIPGRSSPARSCWMRCGTTKGSMWRTTRFPSR